MMHHGGPTVVAQPAQQRTLFDPYAPEVKRSVKATALAIPGVEPADLRANLQARVPSEEALDELIKRTPTNSPSDHRSDSSGTVDITIRLPKPSSPRPPNEVEDSLDFKVGTKTDDAESGFDTENNENQKPTCVQQKIDYKGKGKAVDTGLPAHDADRFASSLSSDDGSKDQNQLLDASRRIPLSRASSTADVSQATTGHQRSTGPKQKNRKNRKNKQKKWQEDQEDSANSASSAATGSPAEVAAAGKIKPEAVLFPEASAQSPSVEKRKRDVETPILLLSSKRTKQGSPITGSDAEREDNNEPDVAADLVGKLRGHANAGGSLRPKKNRRDRLPLPPFTFPVQASTIHEGPSQASSVVPPSGEFLFTPPKGPPKADGSSPKKSTSVDEATDATASSPSLKSVSVTKSPSLIDKKGNTRKPISLTVQLSAAKQTSPTGGETGGRKTVSRTQLTSQPLQTSSAQFKTPPRTAPTAPSSKQSPASEEKGEVNEAPSHAKSASESSSVSSTKSSSPQGAALKRKTSSFAQSRHSGAASKIISGSGRSPPQTEKNDNGGEGQQGIGAWEKSSIRGSSAGNSDSNKGENADGKTPGDYGGPPSSGPRQKFARSNTFSQGQRNDSYCQERRQSQPSPPKIGDKAEWPALPAASAERSVPTMAWTAQKEPIVSNTIKTLSPPRKEGETKLKPAGEAGADENPWTGKARSNTLGSIKSVKSDASSSELAALLKAKHAEDLKKVEEK
jgi:hypothetical protein